MSSQAYDANNIFVNISFGAKYRLRRRLCRLTDIPERAANSANDAALKPNSPKTVRPRRMRPTEFSQ